MRKNTLFAICFALLIFISSVTACSTNTKSATVRTAKAYVSLSFDYIGKDVMPIGGWHGPFNNLSGEVVNSATPKDVLSDEIFQLIKDAGINFFTSPTSYPNSRTDILKILDLCKKYGIGMFVQDLGVRGATTGSDVDEKTAEYIRRDECLGVYLWDEPSANIFDPMAAIFRAFEESTLTSDRYLYSNLHPSYGGEHLAGLGEPRITYYDYLTQYATNVKPDFISYDNYPFRSQNVGTTIGIPSSYFSDLSTHRQISEEYGIPFWAMVQAGGQWDGQVGRQSLPLFPSEGETLWNINTSLVYGAKGMQYFTLVQPEIFSHAYDEDRDYQRGGLITAMGNKTQWYYYIQKANKQIAAIDHILMRSASMGVLATGFWGNRIALQDRPLDESGQPLPENGKAWRELTDISSSDAETGVMIGCFDYNFEGDKSRSAFYVVNSSSTAKQTVSLTFNDNYKYDIIQRGVSAVLSGKTLRLNLEVGEGVMVALK